MRKSNMKVSVDAQVFLRIQKHAKQTFPASCAGSLLGLDESSNLRVTNCFAYKSKSATGMDSDQAGGDEFTEFQYQVLHTLGEVRVDANAVGWYESTHHGNFMNESLIENQFQFQREVPSAVVIIYDPFQQRIGKCGFAAYRLTDAAMKRKQRAIDEEEEDAFADFASDNLMEEVELTMHCSPLVETFLLQWKQTSFDSFDMDNMAPALERNVQLLLESLDEFALQQREMQLYERQTRATKDKLAKTQRVPRSVDTLNLAKQIQEHCRTIDNYAKDSFGKLYMVSKSDEVEGVMTALQGLTA